MGGLVVACATLQAQIVITVPDATLARDTADQSVAITIENDGSSIQLLGLDLNVQVADGGPGAGGTVAGPAITSVDILSPGLLFASNNNGLSGAGSIVPQVYEIGTLTRSGTTLTLPPGASLVARATFDTTGFTTPAENWSWTLNTVNGPTQVIDPNGNPIPVTLSDGHLTLAAAPETWCYAVVAALGGLSFGIVRQIHLRSRR